MLQKYQLRNGLKVVLVESKKSPVVSVQAWVKTGSADEKKGIEGISHFIEHLVFKGSEKYAVGEIAQKVEGAGGQLNAYTSFDQTVFYITISKDFTSTALEMISQMMGYPTFDENEIDNEREVVVEEIKRSNDSLARVASQNMFSTVFRTHPYGKPVIGYDKVVRTVSKKKIVDYYKSRYSPKNMTLIVTGDFDTKKLKPEVKKYFEPIPAQAVKRIKRKTEPLQTRPRISVKNTSFSESRAQISWKIPHALHKDVPALDILATVLGHTETSKLIQRIRNEKGLVPFVFSSAYTPIDDGVFSISFGYDKAFLEEVFKEIIWCLEEILRGRIHLEEIKTAVVNFENEDIYSQQTVDGIANHVGHYMFLTGDPNYDKKLLKQFRQVTVNDLVKVARKYLKPERASISITTNDKKEKSEALAKKFLKDYKKVFKTCEKLKLPPILKAKFQKRPVHLNKATKRKPESIRLSNGIEVLLLETNDVPLFHIQVAGLGGARLETEESMGIGNFLSHTWVTGTDHLGESDLHRLLERNSIGLSAFAGRNTIGLKMTSLSKYQQESLDLFFDVLKRQSLNSAVVERERNNTLTSIKNRVDNPSHLGSQAFMEMLFPSHPYSFDLEGKTNTVSAIQAEDILAFRDAHLTTGNLKLAVVGAVDKKLLVSSLEKGLADIPKGKSFSRRFVPQHLNENRESHLVLNKEQTHIFLGYQGLVYNDPDKYALYVLNSILSGQGGRLFIELRDKASLAYSVSPVHMEGLDAGYFGAYIACSPEKKQKAIAMLRAEFAKMKMQKVSTDELIRAKRSLIGRHDIALQKNSSIATSILFDSLYGLTEDEYILFKEKIKKVSADDIQRLAEQIFSQAEVLSVVGPA